MHSGYSLRPARREDIPAILGLIKELAEYEKLGHLAVADPREAEHWIFGTGKVKVLLAELDGEGPVGFALYFYTFSTFLGKCGLWLEDLYVRPAHRGKGIGKAFFARLGSIAREEGLGRLELNCLDWNENSIEFYRSLGARPQEGWTTYRFEGEALRKLGETRTRDTRFFEAYAALTLGLYHPRWQNFALGEGVESPDLQHDQLGLGIEVTRAIARQELLTCPEMDKYFPPEDEGLTHGLLPDFRAASSEQAKVTVVPSLDGLHQYRIHLADLGDAVIRKTRKLNKNYKIFPKNHLYIYSFDPHLTRDQVEAEMARARQETADFPVQFDCVFVNAIRVLWISDSSGELMLMPLEEDTLRRFPGWAMSLLESAR